MSKEQRLTAGEIRKGVTSDIMSRYEGLDEIGDYDWKSIGKK